MKTRFCVPALLALSLVACDSVPRGDGSSYYYPSANLPEAASRSSPSQSIASMAGSRGAPVPRGGYAPGSGPTAMPQGNQFMYHQNVSGPFGSRSSSGVINAYGGVQSYQTIGNMPVYPGMAVPYNNQRYNGRMPTQPVYVPGVGGAQGYYMNPSTGARVPGP
ncbi:MAG: hypothetical protein NTY98_27680 [Verrucomicrobia bacterium]|nr:hypothetical protein [Verrucomicrobiota bacterium]